jgi:hypothetical protein|tara:strand:+ start:431 stop:652 length:222 start_codon:yes stop_codon:yes gene_type:complete
MSDVEEKLLFDYEVKVMELQSYLECNEISQSEYDELIKDFADVDAIRRDIKDEKMKIHAEMVVTHLSKLLTII